MKYVFILGARGYHAKYGGWETFVSNLVDNYDDKNTFFYISEFSNTKKDITKVNDRVIVEPVYVKAKSSIKMFIYSIKSLKCALKYIKKNKIDNPYIYILGLKMLNYLNIKKRIIKKLGAKVIVNPDGLEHKRSKWNTIAKKFFLLSERFMLNSCDIIVCDSIGIKEYIDNKYSKLKNKTTYIAYGSNILNLKNIDENKVLKKYNLKSNEYLLMVGRMVPENNYNMVIKGFMNSIINKDLVIISNIEDSPYYEKLINSTNCLKDRRIHFINGVYDKYNLAIIRKNAFAYIHGHSVGGTNPSLIEALCYTDLNILYNVCFNKYVGQESCLYFNDEKALEKIINNINKYDRNDLGKKCKKIVRDNFTWEIIVSKYKKIFK